MSLRWWSACKPWYVYLEILAPKARLEIAKHIILWHTKYYFMYDSNRGTVETLICKFLTLICKFLKTNATS